MCIIAVKPEKVLFTKAQLKIMWQNNPHGAGFMYADQGEVKVVKGLSTLSALIKAMEVVGPLRKMVLHFRIRTHGAMSDDMTHPFVIRKGKLAMVHNGVIRAVVNETTDKESDTCVFARKLSQNYADPLTAVQSPFHRAMIEAYIGQSKLVFMDAAGSTYILNEQMGEWHKNVWYSNNKYKPATVADPAWMTQFRSLSGAQKEMVEQKFSEQDWMKDYHASQEGKRNRELALKFPGAKADDKPVPEGRGFKVPEPGRKNGWAHKSNGGKGQKDLIGMPKLSHWDRIPDTSHLEAQAHRAANQQNAPIIEFEVVAGDDREVQFGDEVEFVGDATKH